MRNESCCLYTEHKSCAIYGWKKFGFGFFLRYVMSLKMDQQYLHLLKAVTIIWAMSHEKHFLRQRLVNIVLLRIMY